jgi:hypothetical protein
MISRVQLTVICLLLTVLIAVPTRAQNFADPWLRMGIGAKAMAMGTAQTGASEDATAAYWNPAGSWPPALRRDSWKSGFPPFSRDRR